MCSHTFEAAGSSETGRLFVVISGSPSFKSGITSDSFQRLGKTDDIRERFTISVNVGKMHGRATSRGGGGGGGGTRVNLG